MTHAQREIEREAIERLRALVASSFNLARLSEVSVDVSLTPTTQPNGDTSGRDLRRLVCQIKASKTTDQRAWIRKVRHSLERTKAAYHGSVLLGIHHDRGDILFIEVHRFVSLTTEDLAEPRSWVLAKDLPARLLEAWRQLAVPISPCAERFATTPSQLVELRMREGFRLNLERIGYRLDMLDEEFTSCDVYIQRADQLGTKFRTQEKTLKVRRVCGKQYGYFADLGRYFSLILLPSQRPRLR
mmetsp:Transcript_3926/g.9552  ORF Transcript_3926/g.9552 Transcript_3926/m.9552 type:complete len:243 (-) Transcript_3926:186-914(-)